MRILPLLSLPIMAGLALAQPTVNTVSGPVSPGSLTSIFGTGLSTSIQVAGTVPLSTTINDVSSVTLNGTAVPVAYASPTQIGIQVPWEAVPGNANLVVTNGVGSSQPVPIQVVQFAPAIVALSSFNLQALVTNADGSLNGPPGALPGTTSNPATAGDTITIFATGLGPVTPPPVDGASSSDMPRSTTTVPIVMIGGMSAQVTFSGLSPQYVGLYQVSVVVPPGVTGVAVPVQIQIGGTTSPSPATIALH